jgi:hypothetical protein
MNRGIGIFAVLTILALGARTAVTPATSATAKSYSVVPDYTPKAPQPGTTACSEFADSGEGGNSASQGAVATLVGQYLHGTSGQNNATANSLPQGIHFIVATVPDPLHTLLNLQFDRTIEAIQQAAQDEGFTYDSSWLPWKAHATEYSSRTDQIAEDKETYQRELCPGLILFRKSRRLPTIGTYDDTYTHGLFVFLVGEKPTTGINRIQWNNALAWIGQHADQKDSDRALRILGPTFSGSAPSVARALVDLRSQTAYFTNVLLYSGTVRGCSSYRWLKAELQKSSPVPARFSDFNQNDAVQVDRYFRYLQDQGHLLSEVAILSEDETAYGGLPDVPPTQGGAEPSAVTSCEPAYSPDNAPLHLYYPRDISALRSAYQEQSIFSSSASDNSTAAHVVLQPQASQSTHHNTDTIATFSGSNSALAQEAQMYGVVDSLRTHDIRFVVLRSTSTLDYLFLCRFLHRAFPDAFIVTTGPDMLFGREIDSTEFRGVEALTDYPLLPRGQDWTRPTGYGARHAHRVFGSDTMEGTYLAARFLLTDPDATPIDPSPFIHPVKPDISDYGPPFWEWGSSSGGSPSTWLTVVGQDGYWPVAVLTNKSSSATPPTSTVAIVARPSVSGTANQAKNPIQWSFSLSPAWKLCCALAVLAVCLHFYASLFGWGRQNESMFIQFVPLSGERQLFLRQPLLVGLGWVAIGSIVILMFLCSDRISTFLEERNSLWIWMLHIASWVAYLGIVLDIGLRSWAAPGSTRTRSLRAGLFIILPILLLGAAHWAGSTIFDYSDDNGVPTAYRAVHLTSGVSPMVSLLLLLCGFYWWFWQSLCGMALLGWGRPILPRKTHLAVSLARVSDEMATNIESLAIPLPSFLAGGGFVYLLPIVILALPMYALRRHGPESFYAILHSLENSAFNKVLQVLIGIALYLLILECVQLLGTWMSLKRLLLALNRTPLRRTFCALQGGLSMHSLWNLGGTSSRARYTIFSHQLEALFHLRNTLRSFSARAEGDELIRASVDDACKRGMEFVEKRSANADLAMINDQDGRDSREVFCQCTERLLTDFILPEWTSETLSLDLLENGGKTSPNDALPLSEDESTRRAEEFVCLIYVGYLQNLLGRMRTMVLSILGLFAGLAFSLAFYPYTPRPTIAIALLVLLLVLGSVVALVYAGLARDATLSHITNTVPGQLGLGFWVRFASFIGVPVIGLLVAQFPAITEFVTSWVRPSLNAVQ